MVNRPFTILYPAWAVIVYEVVLSVEPPHERRSTDSGSSDVNPESISRLVHGSADVPCAQNFRFVSNPVDYRKWRAEKEEKMVD